jgi:hypothetical protein
MVGARRLGKRGGARPAKWPTSRRSSSASSEKLSCGEANSGAGGACERAHDGTGGGGGGELHRYAARSALLPRGLREAGSQGPRG